MTKRTNDRGTRRPGRKPITEITEPQRRTLAAIRTATAKRGIPPTLHELADILGISPASVHEQITQLVNKGYVRRNPRQARSLEVVREPEQEIAELVSVPIIGRVAAGTPFLAEENYVGELLVEARLVGRARCFALKVVGDSMINAGITDGDYVVVRQQQLAENGEIVVALIGDDATVKRLHFDAEGVELRPENPRMRPRRIGPDEDVRIQGKVIAVRRPAPARHRPPDHH
jgi:repressor LexA